MNGEVLQGEQTLLSVDEFAEKIKSKYPAYQDMDNLELATKIIEKYPVYADQVDLKKKDTSDLSMVQEDDTVSVSGDGFLELSETEEVEFQNFMNTNPDVVAWKEQFVETYKEEPQIDGADYDYRGAWKAGLTPSVNEQDGLYHWGSKGVDGVDLKSESHPTRWKSDYMEITGKDPDVENVSQEEALRVIEENKKDIKTDKEDWQIEFENQFGINPNEFPIPTGEGVSTNVALSEQEARSFMDTGNFYEKPLDVQQVVQTLVKEDTKLTGAGATEIKRLLEPYGFSVYESPGGVAVKAPNERGEVSRPSFTDGKELAKFFLENRDPSVTSYEDFDGQIQSLSNTIITDDDRINTEEELALKQKELNTATKSYLLNATNLADLKAQQEQDSQYAEWNANQIKQNPQEYLAYVDRKEKYDALYSKVKEQQEYVKSLGTTFNANAGEWADFKEQQGNWVGGLTRQKAVGAILSFISGNKTNVDKALAALGNTQNLVGDELYRNIFIQEARKAGYTIPEEVLSKPEAFEEWRKDFYPWSPAVYSSLGIDASKLKKEGKIEQKKYGRFIDEKIKDLWVKQRVHDMVDFVEVDNEGNEIGILEAGEYGKTKDGWDFDNKQVVMKIKDRPVWNLFAPDVNGRIQDHSRKPWVKKFEELVGLDNTKTTEEWVKKKQQTSSRFGKAMLGLAESIPSFTLGSLMGTPGRVLALYNLNAEHLEQQFRDNPMFDNITENEKTMLIAPMSIATAALENFGFRNIVEGKSYLNFLVLGALQKVGPKGAAKSFANAVNYQIKNDIARGAVRVGTAGAAEFETGFLQEVVDVEGKRLYNQLKEEEFIKNLPKGWSKDYWGRLVESGITEALGGLVMGVPAGVSTYAKGYDFSRMTTQEQEIFENIVNAKNYEEYLAQYDEGLKLKVASGEMTKEEAQEQKDLFKKVSHLYQTNLLNNNNFDNSQKKYILGLLLNKQNLEEKINPSQKDLYKNEIEEVNKIQEELNEIYEAQEAIKEVQGEQEQLPEAIKPTPELKKKIEGPNPDTSTLQGMLSYVADKLNSKKKLTKFEKELQNKYGERIQQLQQSKIEQGEEKGLTQEQSSVNDLLNEEGTEQASEDVFVTKSREKGFIDNIMASSIVRLAKAAQGAIKSLVPKVRFVLHNSESDFFTFTGKKGKGYYDVNNNIIHINLSKADITTPLHEAVHALLIKMGGTKQEALTALTNRLVAALKKAGIPKGLANELDDFLSLYSDENIQSEEYIAELTAILGANYKTLQPKQKSLIARWWNKVLTTLGITQAEADALTKEEEMIIETFNVISSKLKSGEEITKKDVEGIEKLAKEEKSKTKKSKKPKPSTPKVSKPKAVESKKKDKGSDLPLASPTQKEEVVDEVSIIEEERDSAIEELEVEINNVKQQLAKDLKKDGLSKDEKIELREEAKDLIGSYKEDIKEIKKDSKKEIAQAIKNRKTKVKGREQKAFNASEFFEQKKKELGDAGAAADATMKEQQRLEKEARDKKRAEYKRTPVKKKTLTQIKKDYSMNEDGFIDKSASKQQLEKELPEGYTVEVASTGNLYIKTPNNVMVRNRGLQGREQKLDRRGAAEIVLKGLENNLTKPQIEDYLQRRGFSASEIKEVFKLSLKELEILPKSFSQLGAKKGLRLYEKMEKFRQTLIAKNKTKKKNRLKEEEIIDKVFERLVKEIKALGIKDAQLSAQIQMDYLKQLGKPISTALSKYVKATRAVIRAMRRKGKDVRAAQQVLESFIIRNLADKKDYSKKEVKELLKLIKQAEYTTLDNALNKVIEFVNKKNADRLENEIDELLNAKFDIISGGKKVGVKVSAAIRKAINSINKELVNLKTATPEEIASQNARLLGEYNELLKNEKELTDKELLRMSELEIAMAINNSRLTDNKSTAKVEQLARIKNLLEELITTGKTQLKQQNKKEAEELNRKVEMLYEAITLNSLEGKSEAERTKIVQGLKNQQQENLEKPITKLFKQAVNFFRWGSRSQEGLDGLLSAINKIPGDILGTTVAEELISAPLAKAELEYKGGKMNQEKIVLDFLEKLYGKKNVYSAMRKNAQADGKNAVILSQEDINKAKKDYKEGKINGDKLAKIQSENFFPWSQNKLMYHYMMLQDPANNPSYKEKWGEHFERIKKEVEQKLNDKTKVLAQWLMDEFYADSYSRYSPAYEARFKTPMPFSSHYAGPIYRSVEKEGDDVMDLKNVGGWSNVFAASTLSRTKNSNPIDDIDAMDALFGYIMNMEYFKAYAVPINEINKLLQKDVIKEAIIAKHGGKTYDLIESMIAKIANRGVKKNRAEVINAFNDVFIFTRLGTNPTIFLKQLTSIPTYANDIGYANWVKYSMKNTTQIKETWKEIRDNSVYMQDRAYNPISQAIETYAKQARGVSPLTSDTKNQLINVIMTGIRLGDRYAIMLGGMPNYLYYKDEFSKKFPKRKGESEEVYKKRQVDYAIAKFEKDTRTTQQSSDLMDKDFTQTELPLAHGFNMFLTTPKQYWRKEVRAIREMRRIIMSGGKKGAGIVDSKGDIKYWQSIGKHARTLFTYHFVMPMVFQWASLGFPIGKADEEDKQDLLRAAILGNVNAIFAFGDILLGIANKIQGKPWADKNRNITAITILNELLDKVYKVVETKDGQKKQEAFRDLMLELVGVASGIAGVPIPAENMFEIYQSWAKIIEGDYDDRGDAFLRFFTYSDYVIEGPTKRKGTKTDTTIPLKYRKRMFPEEYREFEQINREMIYDDDYYLEMKQAEKELEQEMMDFYLD